MFGLLHVVAPDFPGFGYTQSPPATDFAYTFDHLASTVEELIHHLRIQSYYLYIMDYGGPVGLRVMEAHPDRVLGLVAQNGNAYKEGFTDFWDPVRKYWNDKSAANEEALLPLFTFDTTKYQYVEGARDVEKVSPDTWYLDYYFLQLPGRTQIQLDILYDYRTNLDRYPGFQATFRRYQYPTLIVWGKNDFIFGVPGAKAYLRDLPHAELHLLDGGQFALEEYLKEIAEYILKFVKKVKS